MKNRSITAMPAFWLARGGQRRKTRHDDPASTATGDAIGRAVVPAAKCRKVRRRWCRPSEFCGMQSQPAAGRGLHGLSDGNRRFGSSENKLSIPDDLRACHTGQGAITFRGIRCRDRNRISCARSLKA
jgi:hypothetical protein